MLTKLTTKKQVKEMLARKSSAMQMVQDLCEPRGTARARQWVISIPARPDYDPDLVIADSLRDLPALAQCYKQMAELLREAWLCLDPKGTYESTEARIHDALAQYDSESEGA